jgi:hypothetical protein
MHTSHRHPFVRLSGACAIFVALLSCFVPVATLHGQTMMPLPPHSSTYSSMIRGYWFQAPTDFTIVGVRVPTDASSDAQSVQIVRFTAGPPPQFPGVTNNHVSLGLWTNVNSTTMIPCNINIQSGDYIGIYGTRGNAVNSYGAGPWNTTILGFPVTLNRSGHQSASYPMVDIWWEVSSISRVEMYYTTTVTGPNDAGISSIDSPKDFCPGAHDVRVTLRNWGTNALTSVTINWKLNGVTQPTVNWTGVLDTLNMTTRQTQVTLGNRTFVAGVPYTIEAWTSMPNGVVDTIPSNDSSKVTVKAAIAGTFTIGGASPDYPSIAAAVDDLNNNGVCGPVIFNIRNGTYTTNIELGAIPGASSMNTITFQSESGNKANVNITYNATVLASNFVLRFNGAKFVTFRNLTMTATNTTYSVVVDISGSSTDITVENCELIGPTGNFTSTYNAVVHSPSGSNNHRTTIRNCGIRNGSYGFYMYGASTTSYEEDVVIDGNHLTGQYYLYPLMFYYQDRMQFVNNVIDFTSTYGTGYLGYFYYPSNVNISGNKWFSNGAGTRYGIMLYYTQNNDNRVTNNFMSIIGNGASTTYAFYFVGNNNLLTAHNTVYTTSTSASSYVMYQSSGINQRYLNNIFYTTGLGYVWYVATPTGVTQMDYNAYYTTGTNFGYWNAVRNNLAAWQTASGMDANAIHKVVSFKDVSIGDLHLTAPSEDDDDLVGVMLPEVTVDIDGDPRVRPYRGADEACYLLPNSLTYEFVDGSGNPIGFIELPGTVGVRYSVIFPDFDATITMTANFYSVPGNQLMYSQSFQANKLQGQPLTGTSYFNVPETLPTGYYKIELVFNTKNSCGYYRDYMPYPSSLLLVPRGATPCEVWPGDVNNDGIVNYGDRKALNTYIHDANLRSTWLTGPARYRADAAENPLTYIQWSPQASAPWFTSQGCYMDADGNGVVNNLDYIAIKINWMRSHGGIDPKSGDSFMPMTFDMSQNYPNPFNPTTTIQYSVPEQSRVHLRVVDMLGRVVATAVDGFVDAGVHLYTFDASSLPSGQYLAIVNMVGEESGLSFSKTIKMALNK